MPSDPKPPKPFRANKVQWELTRAHLMPPGTKCFCGCGRRANSLHHLVGKDQGGEDVIPNLVPLAGSGTTLCHGAIQYGQRTYDMKTKTYIEPEEVACRIGARLLGSHKQYIVRTKGEWWLEQHYPAG